MHSRSPQDKRSRFAAKKMWEQTKKPGTGPYPGNRPAAPVAATPSATNPSQPPSQPLISPGLPFAEALKGLLTLTEMMRSMRAPDSANGPVEPMIILSSAGIEMRMLASEPVQARQQSQAGTGSAAPSPDWLARIEKSLDAVRNDIRGLQEKLETQGESVESMRAAVAQNEQLVESIVESLSAGEGGNSAALGTLGDLGDLSLDEPAETPVSF